MDDHLAKQAKVLKSLLIIAGSLALLYFWSYTVQQIWNWFLAGNYGIPYLSIKFIFAIALLRYLFFSKVKRSKNPTKTLGNAASKIIFSYIVASVVHYV